MMKIKNYEAVTSTFNDLAEFLVFILQLLVLGMKTVEDLSCTVPYTTHQTRFSDNQHCVSIVK